MAKGSQSAYSNDEENEENLFDFTSACGFCKSLGCERLKLVIASGVVITLILVIFIGVSLGWCVLKVNPGVNFILMFCALLLLAYLESLHFGVVSIEKWDMEQYKDRFPRAYKCHLLVDTPVKVKKFLVGRQFFVLSVVFLLAQITSFPGIPHNFAGMPTILVLILVQTGLPGVALTLNIGQLIGQIFVEEFTLQFMNMYGCEFVIRLSLFAEFIGICHFSWILYGTQSRIFCSKIRKIQKTLDSQGAMIENGEEPMSPTEKIRGPNFDDGLRKDAKITFFDVVRYGWSSAVTIGSLMVICYGIYIKAYVLPTPPAAAYIVAIVTLTILFYLEGLMIAIVGSQYWDPEMFREVYPRAYKVHKLINQPDNVKRFIIGRQFFTVLTNFLLAQIFTFAYWKNDGLNPILFYIGIKSGLVGVFVILSFAQLQPELLASAFPLRFMNMYGSYTICCLCLFFELIGVGHFGWSIYYVTRSLCCSKHMTDGAVNITDKPEVLRVNSAEVLAVKA